MSQENQGNNSASMPNVLPVKRGRGRPRKYDTPYEREEARRRRRRRTDSTARGDRVLVGQMVSGVLDGSFDAGYLLTVRVGETDTVLRGVVFKPGLTVPISDANDVAPHVKMFTRSEIPLPVVQQQNQVPLLTHPSQIQNGWPVMILPINMSALPLELQTGYIVGTHQDNNFYPAAGPSKDANLVNQVAVQALLPGIKIENVATPFMEGQQENADSGVLVSRHTDQSQIEKGKSTNISPKRETAEAAAGKTGQSPSLIAPQKQQPGQKNELPVGDVIAHTDEPSDGVTRGPSVAAQAVSLVPKIEKPCEIMHGTEISCQTKESLNGAATPKRLKEKKKKAPPTDGQVDGGCHQAPLTAVPNKNTQLMGQTPTKDTTSHSTKGITAYLQIGSKTDQQVEMSGGEAVPVEPCDLQSGHKGALGSQATE